MTSKLKPEPEPSRYAYCHYHDGVSFMQPRGTWDGHPQFECGECLAWIVIPQRVEVVYVGKPGRRIHR
jgi:hypothetical protein